MLSNLIFQTLERSTNVHIILSKLYTVDKKYLQSTFRNKEKRIGV